VFGKFGLFQDTINVSKTFFKRQKQEGTIGNRSCRSSRKELNGLS